MTGLLRGRLKVFLLIVTMFALMAAVACEGDRGPAGAAGAPGNPGVSGEPGAPGAPGEPGSPGDSGAPGVAGEPGNPGNSGASGSAGKDGAIGAMGPKGDSGTDGTTSIAGITVLDANGSTVGVITVVDGAASITIIGGGFDNGERISVAAKKGGSDVLLSGSTTVANANGAFTLTADLDGFTVGELFTVIATGDQGNRGAAAFMLIDK